MAKEPRSNKKVKEAAVVAFDVQLVVVQKKAQSLDVGPAVIAGFADVTDREEKLRSEQREVSGKRYDLLAKLTKGVEKAALNDDSIDLSVYFGGDTKAVSAMNDRLGVALGFRDSVLVGEGEKAKAKIVYSKEVAHYFPQKDDGPEVKQRKKTLASNFLHALKKCAQAAEGAIANGITAKEDKKSGTLVISGPAVKKEFGQDKVVLDERQKIDGGKGETITLKAKPSFTQLASMGARKHGAELAKHASHRGASSTPVDQQKLLDQTAKTLITLVSKIEQPDDKQIKTLDKAFSAIAACLGYNVEASNGTEEAAVA